MGIKYWSSDGKMLAEVKRSRGRTTILISDYKRGRTIRCYPPRKK